MRTLNSPVLVDAESSAAPDYNSRRRTRRAERRALGLCDHCGADALGKASCTDCRGADARRRAARPEAKQASNKAFCARQKLTVMTHYGSKCVCCGEDTIEFLTPDHKNDDGNVQRADLKRYGTNFYTWVIGAGFPTDLQILCFNCNMGRRVAGGICPHQLTKQRATCGL